MTDDDAGQSFLAERNNDPASGDRLFLKLGGNGIREGVIDRDGKSNIGEQRTHCDRSEKQDVQ
jgi:hypothetical protein